MRRFTTLAILGCLAGCVDKPAPRVPEAAPGLSSKGASSNPDGELPGPVGLPARVIAEIADADRELHFARTGEMGLLLTRKDGRFLVGPVPLEGEGPEGGTLSPIADAPPAPSPVALVPHGKGFLLAWTTPTGGGDAIWALAIDAEGKAQGEPKAMGKSTAEVVWVDVLHAGRDALVLWEVESRGSTVTLAPWSGGDPVVAAEGAVGWHAAGGPDAVVVGWVDGDPGLAHAVEIGGEGKGAVVELGRAAKPDILVAPIRGRYAAAWTTVAEGRLPSLRTTWVGHGAKDAPTATRPAAAGVGEQVLLGLLSTEDADRVLLAWEPALGEIAPARRRVTLSTGTPQGFGPVTQLIHSASDGAPSFAPDGAGFAAITLAPMGSVSSPPEGAATVPTYVRLGPDLSVRAAEPIRVASVGGPDGIPALVRDLTCRGGRCTAIAQSEGSPSLIALATLPDRTSSWQPPVTAHDGSASAPLASLGVAAEVAAPLADLDAVRLADGRTLVAWVTYFTGDGEPGPTPPRAVLAYRFVEKDGSLGPVQELSKRAVSVGGVRLLALESSSPRDPVALIGWAGPNAGANQVYLTAILADGKKKNQRTLTSVKRPQREAVANEVFDVDLAANGDGSFTCVWSDSRDGNPEIYAAKVDERLGRRGDAVRITDAAGASMEPRVAVHDGRAWIAWSDRREDGAGIWLTSVPVDDLGADNSPTRLDGGEGVPRTPSWAASGDAGFALVWTEDPEEAGGTAIGRLLALDTAGRPASAARPIRLAEGHVTSLRARCDAETCRGVTVGRADDGPLALAAFAAARLSGAPVALRGASELTGGTRQDLALSLVEGAAEAFFFRDRQAASTVHRLELKWPKGE